MGKYSDDEVRTARLLRYSTIRSLFASGSLTRPEAVEILSGLLDPNDPTSEVDDSELLDITPGLAQIIILAGPKPDAPAQ